MEPIQAVVSVTPGYAELAASLSQNMHACFWALGGCEMQIEIRQAWETCQLYIEKHELQSNMQPFCFLVSVYQAFFPPVLSCWPHKLKEDTFMFSINNNNIRWTNASMELSVWNYALLPERSRLQNEVRPKKDGRGERWWLGKCSSDKAIKRTSSLMDF